jgi:cell division protein FtsQ
MRAVKASTNTFDLPKRTGGWRKFRISLRKNAGKAAMLMVLLTTVAGYGVYKAGMTREIPDIREKLMLFLSVKTGLVLENVYLEGQHYTKSDTIINALGVSLGQAILSVPIDEIRENLEKIDWVKYAIIERELPATLHIRIVERVPLALWQNAGQIYLIDEEGNLIVEDNLQDFAHLIIMVGDDAPLYAASFIEMIKGEKDLFKEVSAAIRVGERRWNVRFTNGLEVRLPELKEAEAWRFIIDMYKAKKLFNQPIASIDLRIPDKLYIRMRASPKTEQPENGSNPGKKDGKT